MDKIRTLVAHNDNNVTKEILDIINKLDYVEVIGTANNGIDTYNKIVDLKPEIVFTGYDIGEMNSLDIIKLSKEKLDNNVPIFNFITDKYVSNEEIKEAINIIGNKMNTLVTKPDDIVITNILEDYSRENKK